MTNNYYNKSSLIEKIYYLLGATQISEKHWKLQTNLDKDELPSIWLSIGIDLLLANYISGLQDYPAFKTIYGLKIITDNTLDVIAQNGSWTKYDNFSLIKPIPVIILAGFPGSGKSSIANGLNNLLSINSYNTFTNKEARSNELGFDIDRFRSLKLLNEIDYKRSASYSFPVLFRERSYIFKTTSLIDRFDCKNKLILFIDSHYSRISWRKFLMPDIKIIWLDASSDTLEKRLQKRMTQEYITNNYIKSCLKTKSIADLTFNTDILSIKEITEKILTYLNLPK